MKKIAILVMLVLTLTSCMGNNSKNEIKKTGEVKKTDTVSITYTGSLEDGTIFDASSEHVGEVLSFEVGAGKVISGLESGVIGMKLGEVKVINVPASEAYGESNELELKTEDLKALERVGLKAEDLTVGVHEIKKTGGSIEILRIDGDKIYAKHPSPLAGKNLIFEVTIDEIVPYVKKETVSPGDSISVTYTGSLKDGTIFDASSRHGGVPLEFIAGAGQMIAGFDAGVIGMKLGETKTINIPASQAYGETGTHELAGEDLIFEVKVESIK